MRGRSQRLRIRPPLTMAMSGPLRRLEKKRRVMLCWAKLVSVRAGVQRSSSRRAEESACRASSSMPCPLVLSIVSYHRKAPAAPTMRFSSPVSRCSVSEPPPAASPKVLGGAWVSSNDQAAATTGHVPVNSAASERLPCMDHNIPAVSYGKAIEVRSATGPPVGYIISLIK